MLGNYISRLRDDSAEMLIIPALACKSPADVTTVLNQVEQFEELEPTDPCTDGALGVFRFSGQQTVDDAILELKQGGMTPVRELMWALAAALPVDTEQAVLAANKAVAAGTAFVFDLGMGPMAIDKAKFAKESGLPLNGSSHKEFRVTVYPVSPDMKDEPIIVAVRTASDAGTLATEDLLTPYFERIENRGGHDNYTAFTVPGLKNGWDLKAQPRFIDLIFKLRPGYGYIARSTAKGLNIEY